VRGFLARRRLSRIKHQKIKQIISKIRFSLIPTPM